MKKIGFYRYDGTNWDDALRPACVSQDVIKIRGGEFADRPAFIIPFPLFVDSGRPPIPHLNDSISPAPAGPGSTLCFIGYLVVLVLNGIPRGCFNSAKHMSDEQEKFPQESGPTVNLSRRFNAALLYAFASSFLS